MQNPFTELMTFLKNTDVLSATEKADYAENILVHGFLSQTQKAALEKKLRARMAQ